MMFSIKMRSSKGGPHEKGGRHISGIERIVNEDEVEAEIINAYRRARMHERGDSDFINIKIEKVNESDIIYKNKLNIKQHHVESKEEGLALSSEILQSAGVSEKACEIAIQSILNLTESMHGAMLIDKDTGERLDERGMKGVRVTGISSADINDYRKALENNIDCGIHLEEALILASKVTSARGVTAELCWSDDPNYLIGYVAANDNYERIPIMKDKGNPIGGRVFLVDTDQFDEDYTLDDLIEYLEEQVVLIK